MNYSQTGAYVSLAGLIVAAASHFGFVVNQNEIVQVLAGLVTLYGIIHQWFSHRQLAVTAGAIKP